MSQLEAIKKVFLQAREIAQQSNNPAALSSSLAQFSPEHIPVACEGLAMELAIADFSSSNELSNWSQFTFSLPSHLISHGHVGLGWAIGFTKQQVTSVIKNVRDEFIDYVCDGLGYFHGTFKMKNYILMKAIPVGMVGDLLSGYDQGLGRSCWYSQTGNIEKVVKLISSFPLNRQKDLWRGVGIACNFVGETNTEDLQKLYALANSFQKSLKDGLSAVIQARQQAGIMPDSVKMAMSVWT